MTTKNDTEIFKRPPWDEYFIQLADMIGSRGTCDRARAGCVITKDKRILSTGYVGSPVGIAHCDEVGHEMQTVVNEDGIQTRLCIRTAHSEQNAINNAARAGMAIEGGTIYTKVTPCYNCAQSIINSGIVRVVVSKDSPLSSRSKQIFEEAKIEFIILSEK